MNKKIIAASVLSLFLLPILHIGAAKASEVTGTLSSNGVATSGNATGGSLSGSVTGGSTSSGGGGGGTSSGGTHLSSGGGGGSLPAGQVLGASIGPTDPGFPSTGKGGWDVAEFLILGALMITLTLFSFGLSINARK